MCYQTSPYCFYPAIFSPTSTYLLIVRMLTERTELEKFVEEVIKKFMNDKAMSQGVHASLTKGLYASPSTEHHSKRAGPAIEKRSKNRDDLANVK